MIVGSIVQLTNNPSAKEKSINLHDTVNKYSKSKLRSLDHLEFFKMVLDKTIKLSNDQDATCFTSWKVGGQDFYVYGVEQS